MTVRRAVVLLSAAIAAALAPVAQAATPPPGAIVTDGWVRALVRGPGASAFAVGDFRHVGTLRGALLTLDPASGQVDPTGPFSAREISGLTPEPGGSVLVSGALSHVDGAFHPLVARLLPGGRVDPAFRPPLRRYGFATTVLRAGDRVYVAGSTLSDRAGLVALDAETGAILARGAFSEEYDAGMQRELALGPGPGGRPALFAASDPTGVVAYDPQTLQRLPGFLATLPGDVHALRFVGTRLFAASDRPYELDPATGAVLRRFDAAAGDRVDELLAAGDTLYVAGHALGARGRPVVALDLRTGAADPSFTAPAGGNAYDLVLAGGRLLVGGTPAEPDLAHIGNDRAARPGRLQALDPRTGAARDVGFPVPDGPVFALATQAGRLLAGGRFTMTGRITTSGIAKVDRRSGALDRRYRAPVRVGARDALAAAALPGGRLVLQRYDGVSVTDGRRVLGRHRLPGDGQYRMTTSGGRVLIAGGPASGDSERPWTPLSLTTLDARLRVQTRRPMPRTGYVEALLATGGRIYVAGSFRRWRASGQPAHLAVMALRPDGRQDETFDPHVNGPVHAIARSGGSLLLVGLFEAAHGGYRHDLAAVTLRRGDLVRTFDPRLSVDFRDPLYPLDGGAVLLSRSWPPATPGLLLGGSGPTGATLPQLTGLSGALPSRRGHVLVAQPRVQLTDVPFRDEQSLICACETAGP